MRIVLQSSVSFLALSLCVAWAQRPPAGQQGGASSTAPAGPTAPLPSPGRGQPGIGQPSQQDRFPSEQRPIFFSGKVMIEGGLPPPEPVTIERVCNGRPRPEAYTDSKGRFSFQLGQQTETMMDASVGDVDVGPARGRYGRDRNSANGAFGPLDSSNPGVVNLMGCELRASLPGYRSDSIMLSRRSIFDNPDVGTIILHPLANVQATAISITTLEAPKDAKKAWEKAQKLLQQKNPKPAEAAKELEKAVQVYPKFAAAWCMLGESRLALKDEEGARKAFEQSLAADSKYARPYMQLASLEMRASRWDSAADITSRLSQMNPYYTQAYYINAIANYNLGKMELAERSARNALKGEAAGRNPALHHLLGSILAREGNFPSAAGEFRSFLQLSPDSPAAEQIRKQLAEWESLNVIPHQENAVK
ncbi:MAG TPA: tetratricopeptide repeat protein [Bryobacterales bacterium]|jgi:Flp pilus assembly protein TadD|nr:tetratricopeptide repeat protein [Bryobacterales bacterium]